MTNQTSEDELREELRKVIWYELGDGLNGTDVDECAVTLLNIIRTEKLKLLAEVRERVVGEDVNAIERNNYGVITRYDEEGEAQNELRAEQRELLTKLEAEL